jgi:hypothetical protein
MDAVVVTGGKVKGHADATFQVELFAHPGQQFAYRILKTLGLHNHSIPNDLDALHPAINWADKGVRFVVDGAATFAQGAREKLAQGPILVEGEASFFHVGAGESPKGPVQGWAKKAGHG